MNNCNEEANVIVVKETLKQQSSDNREIIEDDTKATLKGNNEAPCNIPEPPVCVLNMYTQHPYKIIIKI